MISKTNIKTCIPHFKDTAQREATEQSDLTLCCQIHQTQDKDLASQTKVKKQFYRKVEFISHQFRINIALKKLRFHIRTIRFHLQVKILALKSNCLHLKSKCQFPLETPATCETLQATLLNLKTTQFRKQNKEPNNWPLSKMKINV